MPNDTVPNVEARPSNEKRKDDAQQRWQKITIDQFGYTLNLVLTFTVAALGYWFVLLTSQVFTPGCWAKWAMLASLFGLVVSGVCGLWCSYNRLKDFRETARRARTAPDRMSKEDLKKLGERSWILLQVQLVSFGVGVLCLGVALVLAYGGKLV